MVYPCNVPWTNHRCEKLAQSFYAVVPGRDPNPRPLNCESDALPRHHDANAGNAAKSAAVVRMFWRTVAPHLGNETDDFRH